VTITMEKFDWGIRDRLTGRVGYDDVFRALQKSWIELDWDDVNRRLAVFEPDLEFVFADKEPTVLARILRASLTGKRYFRYALVVQPGDGINRAYAEEYARDVDQEENAVARVFECEDEALAWLKAQDH